MKAPRVFMIGWEYPPFNSGGLGVACEGITTSLAQANTQIFFTLPHTYVGGLSHMKVLSCVDPSWDTSGSSFQNIYSPGPFAAYTNESPQQTLSLMKDAEPLDSHELSGLPQSELENKVEEYAEQVVASGIQHRRDFDVIHAHDWMSFPAGMRLAQALNKPLVTHVHSTEHDRIPSGTGSQYIHKVEYEGMQHSTRVVAVSQYTKQLLIDKYNISSAAIDVVHNGIHPLSTDRSTAPRFARNRPVVVFMGRLTAQKGAPYFLQLAAKVLKQVPDALFIVAGDGDMYRHLLFSAAFQHLSASVLFSGFVRDRMRDTLLDRADVFVMPSLSEPFGLVALEAAQRQTPVIMSRTSGVSEVLPGGIALDFWDIEKMVQNIVSLVTQPELRDQVVNNQLDDLKNVTWDRTAAALRSVYRKALSR